MSSTETNVNNLKINTGSYSTIQANLSSIGENELIITDDKNIPIPTSNDSGKVVSVDSNGEFALTTPASGVTITTTSGSESISDGTNALNFGSNAFTSTPIPTTGTSSGNVPVLDSNGKLSTSILPALAITDTFVVSSEASMLALTAQVGDICVRTDLNKSFILKTDGASTLANWQELLTPTSAVSSVNGKTGAVTINASDVSALDSSTKYGKSLSVSGTSLSLKDQDGSVLSTVTTQDTTYSSQSASQGGTTVSLVTTGEKYTWNNKQNALPTTTTAGQILKSTTTAGTVQWDTAPKDITIKTTTGSESVSDGSNTVLVVTRNTAQTISGAKTFSNAITLNGGISGTHASLTYNSANLAFQYDYVKLSSYVTNSTTTTGQKTFNIQTITGDTNPGHVYEIYGSWHLYKTSTCYGWLWSDLWGYSSGTSTPFLNPTANSRVSQTAFVVPCYAKTDGLKAITDTAANESFIAIYGYRRIK